jgi:hypothetical protein
MARSMFMGPVCQFPLDQVLEYPARQALVNRLPTWPENHGMLEADMERPIWIALEAELMRLEQEPGIRAELGPLSGP